MSDNFYRVFEDKYRGSRELIKSRQRVYLPFIEPLLSFYKDAKAIDLGCGRGEWLELLKDSGFDEYGVDLDDGMLSASRELGLSVAMVDAVEALKALPDESQLVVTGFHIAEHIPFIDLQVLVKEALRVLKPAGLLILETPNPENIAVGTVNFYLDPTHQRPIPPQLLSFLPEYYGFAKVKVVRLQEDKEMLGKASTSLGDVLSGVSPDYAVVAQKFADEPLLACTKDAFAKEYGLTLNELVEKFDQQGTQASERAVSAEAQAMQASERAVSAEAQALQSSERAVSAEAQALQASERAASAETQALQASERAASAETQALQSSERATLAEAQAQQASERAASAEAQALQASERAASAETQALQASERAASAETQALQASERAASAETQAMQASERAVSAETQAMQASERAVSAEAQAQQASERAASAETQALQASERAASAETQAMQASERAASAETQAMQASERAASAETQAMQASERAASAETQALQASERAVNAASALTAVHNSSSWRLTAPLRMAGRVARALLQWPKVAKAALKTKIKLLLAHAKLYVIRRPKLRHAVLLVLAQFPTLKARLKVATVNKSFAQITAPTGSTDLANLTPRARQIYADLKAAIERRQKENG